MKKKLIILVSLVEKHYDDICFLVDVDYTFVQAATPRVRWLRPLGYEINVDEAFVSIAILLAEEVDKNAKTFGNYELDKSKITMELKTTSVIKKNDKLVKKLKAKFGEGAEQEEEEEEEESQAQAPLSLTQGLGEDQQEEETKVVEGAKEEEVKEAPTPIEPKKRKAKAQPLKKSKKVAKLSQPKPIAPTTKASARAIAQKDKEKKKPTEQGGEVQKKQRWKYVAQVDSDEEKKKSHDNNKFIVVSHNPLSDLENLCENVKNSTNLLEFTHVDFDNLGKVEKNQVEEAIYTMMEKFKSTSLEIANSMPKILYDRVEQKWHYCLNLERKIRETFLPQVMPELNKAHIAKAMKKYAVRFVPKYRAFSILQNNIEDVVKKSTQMWKVVGNIMIG